MEDFIKFLQDNKIPYKENESLKNYCTYKIGEKTRFVVEPKDTKSLVKLIEYVKENNIKHMIIGYGSNLIFPDTDYDGAIIRLVNMSEIEYIGENLFKAGAGISLQKLAMTLSSKGYTGIEFATAIPGTLGGAIYMNAGAYKSDMGYIISHVEVLTPDLKIITLANKELNFHYRTSFFQSNPGYIILNATISLKKANVDEIMELIKDRSLRRKASQPIEYPSAGSVFRNPEEIPAGMLIEELGLKNKTCGGAQISSKHANFIINIGNAKGSDILKLIKLVKEEAKEKRNIELKEEQKIIKWD